MYEYFLLGTNPKKSLYDELEGQFQNEDPLDVISDFKAFISEYKTNVFESNNKLDYSFFYLRWSIYWKTIITSALHLGYYDIDELKKTVRRYFYLFWIAGFTLSRIKQTFFNMIKWLKAKRLINEIKQDLENSLNENKVFDRVERALNGNIYHEAWCKPLLILLEYFRLDNPNFISLDDKNIHVEHVLPQSFHEVYGWKHIIEDERDGAELGHTLVKLTLLSGKKNIEASNDSFENKVSIYSGSVGNSSSNETSFRITQKIYDDYNQKKFDKWDFSVLSHLLKLSIKF